MWEKQKNKTYFDQFFFIIKTDPYASDELI